METKLCPAPFEKGFRMLNIFNLHNEEIPLGFLTFRMFADLDKCERIYHSKSFGFDQKRARTFKNGLTVFEWRCSQLLNIKTLIK